MVSVVSDTLNWLFPMMMWFSSGPQYHAFPANYTQNPMHFSIQASLEHQSNSLNAELLKVISGGKQISPLMKSRTDKRLKNVNRLGLDLNAELSFVHFPEKFIGKKRNWGYYLGYKNRVVASGRLSRDTYKLMFYGNAPFKGDTLHFRDDRLQFLAYQQLSFGLIHQMTKGKWTGNMGFALSYINASNFADISIRSGHLYTSDDAFTLNAGADFAYYGNDASKGIYHYPNGWGLGADFFLNIQDPTRKNSISIKAQDFGFVQTRKFSQGMALDTSLNFEGVVLNSPYDLNGDFFQNLGDSAMRIVNEGKFTGRRILPLPAQIQIAYNRELIPFKLYGSLIFSQRLFSGAMPMGTIRVWGYPDAQIMIGGSVSYGGWGSYSIGVDLGFDLGKGWVFNLGTNQLQGLVAEKYSSGFGGYFGMVKSFSGIKSKKNAGKS